jgi:hypothetical protein
MIPVLVVAFRRIPEFRNLLHQLASTKVERIYVAIDGSTGIDKIEIERKFRDVLTEFNENFPTVKIYSWFRDENLGSAVSVITAIEWVFQFEVNLIILEDDLIIAPCLLDFFELNIELIEQSEKFVMMTGTNSFKGILFETPLGCCPPCLAPTLSRRARLGLQACHPC